MKIKIVERCRVDFINEEDSVADENLTAIRTVTYASPEDTLIAAFQDYIDNFNCDRIVECEDDFDGECIDFIEYLSVEKVA